MGVTDLVLERTCPEEHLNLSKSGFVMEEGHSGCKSQNGGKGKFSKIYGGSETPSQNFFKLCKKFHLIMLITIR